jgi:mitochondrial fission protein ELM1
MQNTSAITKENHKHNSSPPLNCWIISEGMAGTENQCLGITDHLNPSQLSVKRIKLKFPFNYLCPYLFKKAPLWAIKGDKIQAPYPDIVIASGRKAIPVALNVPNAFKVYVQDPRINPKYFDLVAIPCHDKTRGDNVIVTNAAPNRITPHSLEQESEKFISQFDHLPPKKISLLIGGNSKTHTMPDDFAQSLFQQLLPLIRSDDYGFLITVSRRTPHKIMKQLQSLFSTPNCFFWDGTGDNPYHAFLANANIILATEDSTSMLSDALTAGKPTYRVSLQGQSAKFDRLYKNLESTGGLRVFEGKIDEWTYPPLNDAQMVADEIKKYFAKNDTSL